MEFELKPEHLKLLRAMPVEWIDAEAGAPGFSCKRPFGKSSSIDAEIADILGIKAERPDEGFTDDEVHNLRNIYAGTNEALQIVISNVETGAKPGVYESKDGQYWTLKKSEPTQ